MFKFDCKFFNNDRPCDPHKREGLVCGECKYYNPIQFRILIIKLDAVGDVLRTTFILPIIKKRHPGSHITWITRSSAALLFSNNHLVDRVLVSDSTNCIIELSVNRYDLCYSLDSSPDCAKLSAMANASAKIGFVWGPDGWVIPTNEAADEWFRMGLNDDLKKNNTKTYQDILLKIIGIDPQNEEKKPKIFLSDSEVNYSNNFRIKTCLDKYNNVVGLNIGSGGRWPLKRWNINYFIELIHVMQERLQDVGIVILGGPEETELLKNISDNNVHSNVVVISGNQTLREFIAVVETCDIVVTGDTLCLHIAIALNKKLCAIFGPTSSDEIEITNGRKIVTPLSCRCCYLKKCDKSPNCMDVISVNEVFETLNGLIKNEIPC